MHTLPHHQAEAEFNCPIYLLLGFEVLQNFPPYVPPQEVVCGREFLIKSHHGTPLNPTVVNSQQQHPIWSEVSMPQSIVAHGNSQYSIQGIFKHNNYVQ